MFKYILVSQVSKKIIAVTGCINQIVFVLVQMKLKG